MPEVLFQDEFFDRLGGGCGIYNQPTNAPTPRTRTVTASVVLQRITVVLALASTPAMLRIPTSSAVSSPQGASETVNFEEDIVRDASRKVLQEVGRLYAEISQHREDRQAGSGTIEDEQRLIDRLYKAEALVAQEIENGMHRRLQLLAQGDQIIQEARQLVESYESSKG